MATKVIKIEIPIETKDNTGPVVDSITEKLEKLDSAAQKTEKSMGQTTKSAEKVSKGFESATKKVSGFERALNQSMNSASRSASGFEKSVEKSQKSLLAMAKEKYQVLIEAKDRVSPIAKQALNTVKSISGKTWNVTMKAVDMVTAPVRGILNILKNPILQAGAVLGVSVSLKDTVDTYSTFEATMSRVKALSNANSEEMERLTATAKEMGAVTKYSGTESAEAFTYMAQAGWSVNDMISGIGGVMSLAAADGLDLASTTDIVSNALTAFGLKAKDSAQFADVLAVASSATNTDVYDMGEAFKYVAPVAGAMGYSIQDASLAIGLMSNNAVKGSMAGTALKTSLANMASPTDNMAAAMKKYGISLTDSEGNMKSLKGVLDNLRSSLGGLSETEQTAAASTIFGKEAMAGMLSIINTSEEDYRSLAAAINDSEGAADRMASTMQDNLAGTLEQLGGAVETVQLSWGERLKPYIASLANLLADNMPAIEDFGLRAFNALDQKIEEVKGKIEEFTGTDEWANADFFGKVQIAWDELVAEPFSEWWSSSGKLKVAGVARDIGTGIGTAISTGIMALMGIDVPSVVDEGSSIGRQFAEGFSEGMSGVDVASALGTLVSGAFSSAGKLLPGGAAPDIGSLFSAAAIAKVAGPMLSLGSGVFKAGKGLYKSTTGGVLKNVIGGFSVADELAGVGNASGSGLLGLAGKAGMALGSGASTSAGLALAGAGGIAGGVVGGAALVSGGMDAFNAYKAYKAGDTEAAKAQGTSAGLKIGGVGAGAAAGAAIGSIFGGIGAVPGALIGAGVGGLAGWLGGNKVKKDYEESAAAAELLAEKSKYALEGAKFDSKELGEAFKDTNVSAEQFGNMMLEATSNKIQDSFGNIKLSVQEISDAAKQIVFGDQEQAITGFASAASEAENSLGNLKSSIQTMDKLNWKASLGMEFDEADITEYMTAVDNMVESASQYLEDKHYEAKAAIDLLVEPGNDVDMTSGLNQMYADLQSQIESLGTDLKAKVSVALEDGVITMDEQAEITNLQNQIADITNQISQAETEASFQSLKIKYSGASLDASSFASLVQEVQANVQEAASSYDEALQVSLTNLNLQLQNGAINQEQFDAQLQALTEGYQAKITDLSVNVESFELQSIADAFGSELDGILPDLEGTVAERLGTAMHNAMANGVDVENWDVSTASEWLDLDGLSAETQSAVTEMMSQVAASLPEQMTSALEGSGIDMTDTVNNMLTSSVENADMSEVGAAVNQKLGESLNSVDVSESGSGLQEGIQNSLAASIDSIDLSEAGASINQKLGESLSAVDMSESGAGLQEGIQSSLQAALEGIDLSSAGEMINTSLMTSLSSVEGIDMSGFTAALQSSMNSSVEGLDYSGITSAVGAGVSEAILASMGTIQGAITTLYSQVGAAINSAFAAGFTTTTTVTITVNYQLANPSATINFSGGGSGTATVSASISGHAEGGFVNGPELSWVGEDGPEAIIPLGSKRRSRGLDLWRRAGQALGVPQHAEGGIIGENINQYRNIWENEESPIEPISESNSSNVVTTNVESERNSDKKEVSLSVTVNPQFIISGNAQREEDILQIIRSHMKELADELGGELAERLGEVFSNMPANA